MLRVRRASSIPTGFEILHDGAVPAEVRAQARQAYGLFRDNPHHPSLRFKKVHPTQPIYSVRVTRGITRQSES